MAQSRKVLSLDVDEWGFLEEVHILGIHAPALEMYRFAYFLNEEMLWNLDRCPAYRPKTEAEKRQEEEAAFGKRTGDVQMVRRADLGTALGVNPDGEARTKDGTSGADLGTALGVNPDGEARTKDGKPLKAVWGRGTEEDDRPSYVLFSDYLLEDHLKLYLLENRRQPPLVPDEDCDYFLIACGFVECFDFDALTQLIESRIPDIFQVYEVDARRHGALTDFLAMPGIIPNE